MMVANALYMTGSSVKINENSSTDSHKLDSNFNTDLRSKTEEPTLDDRLKNSQSSEARIHRKS